MAWLPLLGATAAALLTQFALGPGWSIGAWLLAAWTAKAISLRRGGQLVMLSLGGTAVDRRSGGELDRRLASVVHELARKAAMPSPLIFVLRDEPGVNACVAGHGPSDAAVGVTAGALQRFNREELAAVVARALIHVQRGRGAFDLRLLAALNGCFLLSTLAYQLAAPEKGSRRFARPDRMLMALAFMILGGPLLIFGKALQCLISRRRVLRADAIAAEPLVLPVILREALLKIVGGDDGGRLRVAAAGAAEHVFLITADASWLARSGMRLFAAHPAIARRVAAIEARIDPAQLHPQADAAPPVERTRLSKTTDALPLFGSIAELADLGSLQQRLPEKQRQVTAQVSAELCRNVKYVRALYLAALVPEQLEAKRLALEYLARISGPGMLRAVTKANLALNRVPEIVHLPLLATQLPALDQLAVGQRTRFLAAVRYMTRRLGSATMLRYCLRRLLVQGVAGADGEALPGNLKLTDCPRSVSALFAVLAAAGHTDADKAAKAYDVGMASALPASLGAPYQAPDLGWADMLDAALDELRGMHPVGRKSLVEAMALTIAYDGMLRAPEAELLRTVCLVIGTDMPTLQIAEPTDAAEQIQEAAIQLP